MYQTDHSSEAIDDEQQIVLRATNGDAEAFTILYERYVHRIYNYLFYRTGNALEAEDLTARVFYRALGRIASYRHKGIPFSAWLYRIAHNLVANWYRDNSRKREVPLEEHGQMRTHVEHPEVTIMQNFDNEKLIKAIRKLSPDRQQLIILKFVEHMSNAEIAVIMRRSEGAIKSFYHRTLIALRDEVHRIEEAQEKHVKKRD
ncbi:MAG: sigma-70 family RNA polymerase sigma factor [Anaerolineae bacterium]|nr:sigma-70 family RNA polymerase sigma factor [Anaerolineae bacterium]